MPDIGKNRTLHPGPGSQIRLPFAFDSHTSEFNDSLWTLPHELQMYMLLALVGVCGLLRRPFAALALMLFGAIAFSGDLLGFAHPLELERARFLFMFFAGTTFYLLRDYVPMRGDIVLASILLCVLVAIATRNYAAHRLMLAAMVPYAVLWFSFVPGGPIRRYNTFGDYSYGTYILAAPIQVFLALRIHSCPALLNLTYALLLVLPLSALSWHFLESPALSLGLPKWLAPIRQRLQTSLDRKLKSPTQS